MTSPNSHTLPPACGIALKEWAGVCEGLAQGRQALLLRKGGVAEGRGGFQPEHEAFWLYPTHVHEAEQGLRLPQPPGSAAPPGMVAIGALAVVAWVAQVDRPETLAALADEHPWTETTVQTRFQYRRPGLWVLVLRVYRRASPILVEVTPAQAGCKSWVELEHPLATEGLMPVLDDPEFARRVATIRAKVGERAAGVAAS